MREIDRAVETALELEREKQNSYSSTKSIAQEVLNLTVIVGLIRNIVGLANLSDPFSDANAIALLVLLILALSIQVVLATLVAILYKTSGDVCFTCCGKNVSATAVNFFVTFLTFVSLANNSAIEILSSQVQVNTTT